MKIIHEAYWMLFKNDCIRRQRKIRREPLEAIKDIQWRRLKKLLNYVYKNNDFYKSIFQSMGITPEDIRTADDYFKLPITNY